MTSVAREGGPADLDRVARRRAGPLRRGASDTPRGGRSTTARRRRRPRRERRPVAGATPSAVAQGACAGRPGLRRDARHREALGLHTVCEEARCPNIGECWGHRTATFMLLGDTCTRNCGFCAVRHGRPLTVDALRAGAGRRGRRATRPATRRGDVGQSRRSRRTVARRTSRRPPARSRTLVPATRVEVLVPDFQGDVGAVRTVVDVADRHPESQHRDRSSSVQARTPGARLRAIPRRPRRAAARSGRSCLTKAGLMLGLGETTEEILSVFSDLRAVDCDILTLGQYLRPSRRSSPDRALRHARGVRGAARAGARRRISSRRVRPAGAQLVSRMGARSIRN